MNSLEKKELSLLLPYKFYQTKENTYFFDTSQGIKYLISFYTINNFFPDYPGYVFEFSFSPENKRAKNDKRISITIINILKQILEKPENAIVFIYESSDNKQFARQKLFEKWFNYFGDGFQKYDAEIMIDDNITYYNSLITSTQNPFKTQLINAYSLAVSDITAK